MRKDQNTVEKIYTSSLKFLSSLTLKSTFIAIISEGLQLVGADYGSIFLGHRGKLTRVYSTVPSAYQLEPQKEGPTYRSFKTGKADIVNRREIRSEELEMPVAVVHSIIIIPLSYETRTIGVLTFQSIKKNYFQRKALDVLKLFGAMASLAIRKSQLYTEAKKAIETRDLFISLAAHELRTPLSTITGYTDLILRQINAGQLPEPRWASVIWRSTQRLKRLITEFLEVDQIRKGTFQYDFKEESMGAIIKRSLEEFSFKYPERIVQFNNLLEKKDDLIIADFEKIMQVVLNVLSNSAKYSAENTPITLTLLDKKTYIHMVITDKGKGIAKKDLPKIFKEYFKGGTQTDEGVGLGLYLSRRIVQEHKGSISIDSQLHRGTRVKIKLRKFPD